MSFDPQFSADAGSDGIIDHIYESMLDYDYLARPVKLVPRTLEAMPTVEDGGATYVFRLKRESSSRPIRRSRASRASSPPPIRRTRSSACSIPR